MFQSFSTAKSNHQGSTQKKMTRAIALLVLLCVVNVSSLDIIYLDGTTSMSQSYRSPTVEIPGTSVPFVVSNKQVFIPADHGNGCEAASFMGSSGKVAIVNSNACEYSIKIRNAFNGGASGLIIQWSEDTEPGFNYKWAARGIDNSDGINLPTVEILGPDGDFLIQKVVQDSSNTKVSFKSGEQNAWKTAFEGPVFIVLFQVFLSICEGVLLIWALTKMIGVAYFRVVHQPSLIGRKVSPYEIFVKETASYMYYLTILGTLFSFLYVSVDPFHSRGVYNQMTDAVFTTFSFPSSFIATFLMAWSLHTALSGNKIDADSNWRRTITGFGISAIAVFASDLIGSILKGAYIINQTYVYIAGGLYLVFPGLVIIFFIVSTVRFSKKRFSEKNAALERFIRVCQVLGVLYFFWLVTVSTGIAPKLIQTPNGRITMFFFYFFITGLIHAVHIWFIPDPRKAIRQEAANSVPMNTVRTNPSQSTTPTLSPSVSTSRKIASRNQSSGPQLLSLTELSDDEN